jgi:hypothetical protein
MDFDIITHNRPIRKPSIAQALEVEAHAGGAELHLPLGFRVQVL